MLHPSYTDLMKVVNKDVEEGETKVVNSRYSIVMATAKRAREIIGGDEPLVNGMEQSGQIRLRLGERRTGRGRRIKSDTLRIRCRRILSDTLLTEIQKADAARCLPFLNWI